MNDTQDMAAHILALQERIKQENSGFKVAQEALTAQHAANLALRNETEQFVHELKFEAEQTVKTLKGSIAKTLRERQRELDGLREALQESDEQ